MHNTSKIRVKICCISSPAEAVSATRCGADVLGLVGPMPSGPGIIDDELIRRINRGIAPGVSSFLLTSETTAEGIIAHYRKVHTDCIQLTDAVPAATYPVIRKALPAVKLIQVIHVVNETSVSAAQGGADLADALLLDSGNPQAAVKEPGGTGRVHNWEISRKIRDTVNVPIWLAGGLHAGNVRRAIETVRPFGVDLCSGVRTAGKLDEGKLGDFFAAVNAI